MYKQELDQWQPKAQTVQCPRCEKRIALRHDGEMRKHRTYGWGSAPCNPDPRGLLASLLLSAFWPVEFIGGSSS